jgi:ABC-2 type transport system ATP-binding protein
MRHIGALLEAKPYHPTRKARNHLRMLAAANAIPVTRVDEVLEMVGLAEVARAKPKGFSLGMGQRLGLAAALLGDPHTLILDEPANGLDPQGIQWMRVFLKALAAEGRSVFVSSHLLSEMALMADHLVVIGKGRLIATGAIAEFVSGSQQNAVVVRTPDATALVPVLQAHGARVTVVEPGLLSVTGIGIETVGDLAFEHGFRLHQLSAKVATLEEAFLERTAGAEEFQAGTR